VETYSVPDDPFEGRRQVMLESEFDAVDYFVNEPDRPPPPPLKLGVYLASALSQPGLAERLPGMLTDMQRLLDETTPVRMRPDEISHAVAGRPVGARAYRGPATLRPLTDALRTGEVEGLGVSFGPPTGAEDRFWHLNIQALPEQPDAAIDMSLVSSDNLWAADRTDEIADRLLRLLESWAEPLDLLTGAVTYDRVQVGCSPYESWYTINVPEWAPVADTCVRGYYWANLLTAGHLDRLGGLEALRKRAGDAGFALTELAARVSAAPAVLVRNPGPVTGFDDDRLARMKELLKPVLHPKPYAVYEGYPLRIVRDPGTAFRRVPPTEPFPTLLSAEETDSA
jgi:hypothetical protein